MISDCGISTNFVDKEDVQKAERHIDDLEQDVDFLNEKVIALSSALMEAQVKIEYLMNKINVHRNTLDDLDKRVLELENKFNI